MSNKTDQVQDYLPQVKFNKNGYEIRTKVLEMANETVWHDYNAKWGQFETSLTKDGEEVVTTVEMPVVPGTEAVLETARKFYEFVNHAGNTKK